MKWYGYIGIILMALTVANFFAGIRPFSEWYIIFIWYGYILLADSAVHYIRGKSMLTAYPKEFAFMLALSLPYWLIFEAYNLFTASWIYTNYVWYVHLFDFTTIMPAVLETFMLVSALGIGKRFDRAARKLSKAQLHRFNAPVYRKSVWALVALGAVASAMPVLVPKYGFMFMWVGLFLLIDPLNYLTGRPSIVQKVSRGEKGIILRMFMAGLIMGLMWEFWNYQAFPRWHYNLPFSIPGIRLFAMPVLGYFGYLPFAMETFLFFALFRSFIFKGGNDLLEM